MTPGSNVAARSLQRSSPVSISQSSQIVIAGRKIRHSRDQSDLIRQVSEIRGKNHTGLDALWAGPHMFTFTAPAARLAFSRASSMLPPRATATPMRRLAFHLRFAKQAQRRVRLARAPLSGSCNSHSWNVLPAGSRRRRTARAAGCSGSAARGWPARAAQTRSSPATAASPVRCHADAATLR